MDLIKHPPQTQFLEKVSQGDRRYLTTELKKCCGEASFVDLKMWHDMVRIITHCDMTKNQGSATVGTRFAVGTRGYNRWHAGNEPGLYSATNLVDGLIPAIHSSRDAPIRIVSGISVDIE